MSVMGEQGGIAAELGSVMRALAEDGEWIDEYWEGDRPSFQIAKAEEPEDRDDVFFVTTSTGNRFKVSVEVEENRSAATVPGVEPTINEPMTQVQREAFESRSDFPGWDAL